MPIPEPVGFALPLSKGLALVCLIALYFFGVWLRTYILPVDSGWPLKRQLAAALPIGLLTMGFYAKSALPPLFVADADISADIAIMIGYAIILGMMSRESLERMLKTEPSVPSLPGLGGAASNSRAGRDG